MSSLGMFGLVRSDADLKIRQLAAVMCLDFVDRTIVALQLIEQSDLYSRNFARELRVE